MKREGRGEGGRGDTFRFAHKIDTVPDFIAIGAC